MKAFAIVRMLDNRPEIDPDAYHGFVFCDRAGQWGAYLLSGTPAQLAAINGLSHAYGICAVTEDGGVKWAELDGACGAQVRDRLNTWLANHDYPPIPEGWTYRQVVTTIYRRLNAHFDLNRFDVADAA